ARGHVAHELEAHGRVEPERLRARELKSRLDALRHVLHLGIADELPELGQPEGDENGKDRQPDRELDERHAALAVPQHVSPFFETQQVLELFHPETPVKVEERVLSWSIS